MKPRAAFLLGLSIGVLLFLMLLPLLIMKQKQEVVETTSEVRTDTIRYYVPTVKDSTVVRYQTVKVPVKDTSRIIVRDTLHVTEAMPDSVNVEIPITQKVYADSSYTAWVSGYAAQLDSISVVERTRTIVRTVPAEASRWSIGLSTGYAVTPKGMQPYVGVGVGYRLWNIGKRR